MDDKMAITPGQSAARREWEKLKAAKKLFGAYQEYLRTTGEDKTSYPHSSIDGLIRSVYRDAKPTYITQFGTLRARFNNRYAHEVIAYLRKIEILKGSFGYGSDFYIDYSAKQRNELKTFRTPYSWRKSVFETFKHLSSWPVIPITAEEININLKGIRVWIAEYEQKGERFTGYIAVNTIGEPAMHAGRTLKHVANNAQLEINQSADKELQK